MQSRFESESQFIGRLLQAAPFANQAEAARAARALLQVLGGLLTQDERAALAQELPVELVRLMAIGLPQPRLNWREFHRRVAELAGVPLGLAIEHSEVVCHVLCETLAPATRRHLQKLFPELATLFEPTEEVASPLGEVARADDPHGDSKLSSARGLRQEQEGHTLAAGRPGSRRPISSSR